MSVQINEVDVVKMYNDGYSTYQIKEKYKTYPGKIRKILLANGVKMRTKSEAQKNAIEKGTIEHPTKGKKRTKEERLAISAAAVRQWSNMSDKERERRRKQAQKNWNKMTPEEKERMRKKAIEEVRKAAVEGSKLEKEVQRFVSEAGYRFEAHKKGLIAVKKSEIDLFIPELGTIIEVDGLSHFEPIWGEDRLKEQIKYDAEKDGAIISKGYHLIRIENRCGSLSISRLKDLQTELTNVLSQIKEGTIDSQLTVIKYE